MSSLTNKQALFAKNIAELILWADSVGYRITFGEAMRTPDAAKLNADQGDGIVNSLHTISLAVDFKLYIDGVYQIDSKAYKNLGDYWKLLNPANRWGGDFHKPDGAHFSMEHNGIR